MIVWMDPVLLKFIPFALEVNVLKYHLNNGRAEV